MRRIPVVTSAVVLASALSVATAFATPPTGDLKFEDYTRAQLMENASVPILGGTTLVRASYAIAPGGETGWHRLPGATVLAVNKGKLGLHGGEGCATKDYAAGQAAVIPAGVYMVHNDGSEPLEFFGAFFGQPQGTTKPLAEGRPRTPRRGVPGSRAPGSRHRGFRSPPPLPGCSSVRITARAPRSRSKPERTSSPPGMTRRRGGAAAGSPTTRPSTSWKAAS
jgi:quercetin dioxygenase-like cupin family protein